LEAIFDFFSVFGKEAALFIISMFPIVELRGAIPFGAALGMDPVTVYLLAILGNLLPVPFLVLLIRPIFNYLKHLPKVEPYIQKLEDRAYSKAKHKAAVTFWGLFVFVAIPLPGTGAWTGSLIAALLNMRLRNAFGAICLGVLVAGLIMLVVSFGAAGLIRAL